MQTMRKTDLKRDLAALYRPPRDPVLVDVPPLRYLAIDGEGRPGEGEGFEAAIRALYPVAYTVKFELRRTEGLDVTVMPLEALWRSVGMSTEGSDQLARSDGNWDWTAMILQADAVTEEMVERIAAGVAEKKDLPVARDIRLRELREGRAAQLLYVGPWSEEAPTIERLHAFVAGEGLRPAGAHHEIYLSDPRRTAPERLKTVIRQPVTT